MEMHAFVFVFYEKQSVPFLGSALPLSLFFVFRKRPPFPLALLIAC